MGRSVCRLRLCHGVLLALRGRIEHGRPEPPGYYDLADFRDGDQRLPDSARIGNDRELGQLLPLVGEKLDNGRVARQ